MAFADAHPNKSTIDRIYNSSWPAGRPRSSRVLNGILSWVRDPVGSPVDLEGWSLAEEEIRADLEFGRD